ncbi:Serine/threonine-protein kinase WNK (With No Lysine)-related, partial [Zea mays]
MGGSVQVWHQDHRSDRRQRRRRAAWLHEEGGGGPELRGDAAPEVRLPGEHPGGAAAAPVVGRVPGGRHRWPRRRRRGLQLAAWTRHAAAGGALRPLRPVSGRGGADAHRTVDEQPGGAAVEAAVGRPCGGRDGQQRGDGRRGARRAPRHGRRSGRRERRREHQRCCRRRSILLRERGQAQRGILVRLRLSVSSWCTYVRMRLASGRGSCDVSFLERAALQHDYSTWNQSCVVL